MSLEDIVCKWAQEVRAAANPCHMHAFACRRAAKGLDSDVCSDLGDDMRDTLVRAPCQNVLFWVRPINALRIQTRLRLSITPSGTHGRRGQEARPVS